MISFFWERCVCILQLRLHTKPSEVKSKNILCAWHSTELRRKQLTCKYKVLSGVCYCISLDIWDLRFALKLDSYLVRRGKTAAKVSATSTCRLLNRCSTFIHYIFGYRASSNVNYFNHYVTRIWQRLLYSHTLLWFIVLLFRDSVCSIIITRENP